MSLVVEAGVIRQSVRLFADKNINIVKMRKMSENGIFFFTLF